MARKKRAYVTSYEIYTIDGAVAVDYVGRYESLDADLHTALERAGVKQRLDIPRSNVTRGRKRDRVYQNDFTPPTRDLVAEWYAPEIALFGYEF
jgi:hypothetical protein